MTVLITGAAGFIGTHLLQYLANIGHDIVALDSLNNYYDVQLKLDRLKYNGINKVDTIWVSDRTNVRFFNYSILDKIKLDELFSTYSFSHIIHLAAQPGVRHSIENPTSYYENNISGYFNLLSCIRKYKPAHFIYASSSSVYGQNSSIPFQEMDACNEPLNFYASSKKCNEMMAHSYANIYDIAITGLRFFTVYGPWGRPDMAPMIFARAASNNEAIKVFNFGNQKRDFTYIDDIVEGIQHICFNEQRINEKGHEVFNIGRGEPVGLLDFITLLEGAIGVSIDKEMVEAQVGETDVTYANVDKLKAYTAYSPQVKLSEGIEQFVSWYKTYYKL